MYEPKVRNSQTDKLMKAVMLLNNEEDAYRFFEDLATVKELKSMVWEERARQVRRVFTVSQS